MVATEERAPFEPRHKHPVRLSPLFSPNHQTQIKPQPQPQLPPLRNSLLQTLSYTSPSPSPPPLPFLLPPSSSTTTTTYCVKVPWPHGQEQTNFNSTNEPNQTLHFQSKPNPHKKPQWKSTNESSTPGNSNTSKKKKTQGETL